MTKSQVDRSLDVKKLGNQNWVCSTSLTNKIYFMSRKVVHGWDCGGRQWVGDGDILVSTRVGSGCTVTAGLVFKVVYTHG